MPNQLISHDFVYVHTDIPAGMTIREWRAHCTAERASKREAEREARRHGSRTCAAIGLIAAWARRAGVRLRAERQRNVSREAPA